MTPRETARMGKAERSLDVAEYLLAGDYIEHAISRAYYSMFYAAEAVLLRKGLELSKHSAVASAFGKHFSKTGIAPAQLHRYLRAAGEARITSDYRDAVSLDAQQAREEIARAREWIDWARK